MNRNFAAIAVLAAMSVFAQGADKIATVDLEAVVRSHPKTEGNKQTLRATQKEYEEQRDTLRTTIERLQENFAKASEQANNAALNDKARDAQRNIAREILTDLRREEDALRQLVSRLQRSLNETELLLFGREVFIRLIVPYREYITLKVLMLR